MRTLDAGDLEQSARETEIGRGLSTKLLILTVIFVMIAEVLIFVPSVANFRNVWLQGHLDTAEAASIVYLDATDAMLSQPAQTQLLRSTDASVSCIARRGRQPPDGKRANY